MVTGACAPPDMSEGEAACCATKVAAAFARKPGGAATCVSGIAERERTSWRNRRFGYLSQPVELHPQIVKHKRFQVQMLAMDLLGSTMRKAAQTQIDN